MLVWRRPFGDLPDIKRLRACANKRPRTTTELFSCQGLQSMSAVGPTRKSGDAITISALPPTADIPGVPAVTSEKCEERKSSSNILDGE
jgi:hypothetical protein